MARINLLPHREWERERKKKEFFAISGASVFLGLVVFGVILLLVNAAIANQKGRNAYIEQHIATLEKQVKEIEDLQRRKAELEQRMNVIQGLQGNRPVVVRLFDQLVRSLPDGVYFRSVDRNGNTLDIAGTAESNTRISELMRQMEKSDWLSDANLKDIKGNADFGETASDFNLTVKLVLPGEQDDEENG